MMRYAAAEGPISLFLVARARTKAKDQRERYRATARAKPQETANDLFGL